METAEYYSATENIKQLEQLKAELTRSEEDVDVLCRKLSECQQRGDGYRETLERVEWVFDIEDDGYRSCPWCHGLDPYQHEVDIHAESMDVTIGHSNNCFRQAALDGFPE